MISASGGQKLGWVSIGVRWYRTTEFKWIQNSGASLKTPFNTEFYAFNTISGHRTVWHWLSEIGPFDRCPRGLLYTLAQSV